MSRGFSCSKTCVCPEESRVTQRCPDNSWQIYTSLNIQSGVLYIMYVYLDTHGHLQKHVQTPLLYLGSFDVQWCLDVSS